MVARLVLIAALGGVVILVTIAWIEPYTAWSSGVGFPLRQPVPFSHQHHVAGLGLDCRFCHSAVEQSADAGMPPTHTCMTCHSQVWANAAVLAPVRDSLASGTPLRWARVNKLPDYAYFDHSIHIAKGISCVTCHGRVDEMPLMAKGASLRMAWCIDCHRDPRPNLRPKQAVFDMAWVPSPATPSGAVLFNRYHIHSAADLTDCSVCHR